MTVYVSDYEVTPGRFHLWADDYPEALAAAVMSGAPVEASRPDRSPVHFELDSNQWARAVMQGAQTRDKFDAFGDAMIHLGRLDMLEGVNDWLASEGHAARFNRKGRLTGARNAG